MRDTVTTVDAVRAAGSGSFLGHIFYVIYVSPCCFVSSFTNAHDFLTRIFALGVFQLDATSFAFSEYSSR